MKLSVKDDYDIRYRTAIAVLTEERIRDVESLGSRGQRLKVLAAYNYLSRKSKEYTILSVSKARPGIVDSEGGEAVPKRLPATEHTCR